MRLVLLLWACATTDVEDTRCYTAAAPAALARGPAGCVQAAQALLPSDEAWKQLWGCVQAGHFAALRELLSGAWDRDLRTRPDAPQLILRVIAERGGVVDEDLQELHERRVPLFSLSQACARPTLYRGALLIVRARLAEEGVLDETRVVSRVRESARWVHLDAPTGQRVLATLGADPFLDAGDPVVLLARFEGLHDGDGWPELSVLGHVKLSATLPY